MTPKGMQGCSWEVWGAGNQEETQLVHLDSFQGLAPRVPNLAFFYNNKKQKAKYPKN